MKYFKLYLKKYLMVIGGALLVLSGVGVVYAATDLSTDGPGTATLGFEAYNCTSYDTLIDCYADLQDEEVDMSTYRLADGDSIDAGGKFILISRIDNTGTGISGLNYRINYNNDALNVGEIAEPIEGESVGAFYTTEATDYPYYIVNMKVGKVTVPVPTNKFSPSATNSTNEVSTSPTAGKLQLRGFIEPQSQYSTEVLEAHQRLIYYGLEVADDAAGGTTLPFNYGAQATETDASTSSAARVFLKGDTLTLKVSGGTTSGDNTLKTLEVSYNGTIYNFDSTTPFVAGSKANDTFLVNVPNGATDIDIRAVSNDGSANIGSATLSDKNDANTIFETEDNLINVGTNTMTFQVTAANGDVQVYTINVYRLSNDATLKSLTTTGITLTKDSDEQYSAIVPYSTTSTTVNATVNHQNASISSGTGSWSLTNSGSTVNERKVVVQAENCNTKYITLADNSCTTKTYTIKITRNMASENADLSDLRVGLGGQTPTTIGGFTKKGYVYTLEDVPYETSQIKIEATLDDPLSTLKSGTGTFNINVGDNEYKVIVTGQNGADQDYTIKVHRKSNNTLLHDITITSSPSGSISPAFNKDYTGRYTYTYDPSVTSVTVSATVDDIGKAKITVVDATNGFPSGYASTNKENTASQTFTTPTSKVAVVIVTSENGDIQTYYIDLTRQQSINNSLSALKVEYNDGTGNKTATLSPTFSSSKRTYSVTIPANVDSVVVTPTKAVTYSKVTEIGDVTGEDLTSATITSIDFGAKQITIKVLSEQGVDNEYYLTINRSKYAIATLDQLAFGDGALTPSFASGTTSYTYSKTLSFETTALPISGTITNEYATVKVEVQNEKGAKTTQTITNNASNRTFSGTLNIPTGTNKVLVTVTAHDGTTIKVYETTVKRDKNSDSTVTQIVVDGQTGPATYDDDTKTYSVEVNNTKTSLQPSEVGISVSPDASVSKGSAVTGIKTTEPSSFTFRVIAEDGTYTDYTLLVQRKKNTQAVLTRETVTVGTKTYYCDVVAGSKGCTISVPTNTTSFTTQSTISVGATVNPVDGTEITMDATESTKEVEFTVTSEDGEASTNYTITIERAKSSDNTLSDLQVDGVTVSGFSSTGNLFNNTQGGLTNKVTVTATVNDIGKAYVSAVTVNGNVVIPDGELATGIYTFDANINYGTNNVVITVKAENEQPQNINLVITRQQNTTATIEEILIGYGTNEPTLIDSYTPAGANYTLTTEVPYDTSTIKLVALPSDETYGTAIVTSVKNEKNVVTATNIPNEYTETTSNRYEATITLATGLNTIEVTGTAHNGSTKKYTIKVNRTKNNDSTIADVEVKGFEVVDAGSNIFTVELPNSDSSINTATDITYTAPAGSKVTFSPATMNLLTTQVNDVTMIVTAEDGTATTYTIKITRAKSNKVNISRVSLTITSTDADYNGKSYFCAFDNTDATSCTIDVPASTTAYKVYTTGGDVSTGLASVNPTNGTEYTMDASESTKDLKVTVTAEDGTTTQDYDVTVRRMKSMNADLSSLKVDGTSVANFQRGTQIYYYAVDGDTEEVTISATVYDSRSHIETDLSEPIPVAFGLNNISVKVVAEDNNTTKTYTILLTRNSRKDATLSDIKIDGTSITELNVTPAFDKDNVFEYTIEDEYLYSKTSIEIEGIVNDQPVSNGSGGTMYGAHVTSGNGTNSLKTGTTDITIHVVAHDSTVNKDYVLHIKRAKNNDTTLASVVLAGKSATYNETDGVWEVTVPNTVTDADHSNLTITPSPGADLNDALASVSFTDTALDTQTPTDITVSITAEDGTVGNQTIRVTREKSSVATLHTLNITALTTNDGSFNPSFVPDSATDLSYTVTVPAGATSLRISATTTEPHAKILTNLNTTFAITDSDTQYQVRVESEDGKNHLIYEINIKRQSSNDNTLRKVIVKSGEGENEVTYKIYDADASVETEVLDGNYASTPHYKVTVPGNIDKVNIEAITADPKATIENADTLLGDRTLEPNKTLTINIKVKSEGGSAQTYTLAITRLPKTNNRLSDIKVDNVTIKDFDPDTLEYTLDDVENEVGSIVIGAVKEDEDASIIKGVGTADLKTGENIIEIIVEAQDKSQRTYKLKVKRKQSDDNRLSSLSVNGYQLTPSYVYTTGEETKDYYVTLRYTKDTFGKSDVYALAHNNTATITYDEDITLATGETKSFNVFVTSESGLLNTYTIHVTRSKSDNAYLSSVSITAGESSVGTLNPKFSKNTVEYQVSIPYGETQFTISGIPEVSSTSVQGNNQTYNIADVKEVYLTTYAEMYDPAGTPAEQAATMTYKFIISQALSNNAYLSNLSVDGYPFVGLHTSFSQAYTTYDIGDIDYSVTGLVIHATPENGNSKVTYSVNGGPASTDNTVELPNAVGSGSITITVTAPDGLTKIPYTITYNKVYSSVAYLASLTSDVGTWDKSFMKTTTDYLLTVDNSITSVDITLYTESVLANVSVNGEAAVSATNIKPLTRRITDLPEGDTALTILVTAQDNTKSKTYNVVIRRAKSAANSDATLQSLSVKDYPFVVSGAYTQTTFEKTTTDYSIGKIPYSLEKIKVEYKTTQGESVASILVGGSTVIADSDGYIPIPKENTNNGIITVLVVAPDGKASKTYSIHYTKEASQNAFLSSLVVSNGTLTPAFNKNQTDYNVTLDEGVTVEIITATLEDPTATLTVAGQKRTSPYAYTLSGLGSGTTQAVFVVTAEDGSTLTYYVNVTAQLANEAITSVNYGHIIQDGMIKDVEHDTTGLDLKNQLDNENTKLVIYDKEDANIVPDSDPVGTGMIVKLIKNGNEEDRKLIVVIGDTNGDATVDVFDVLEAANHIMGTPLTGPYFTAGDADSNLDIDVFDVLGIATIVMNS